MVLKDLYEEKLRKYQDTGEMEDPNSMLALLLLDKKDEFFPIDANIKHFYQDYHEVIEEGVYKIEKDFHLDALEADKFWQIYGGAIETLFDGVTTMSLTSGEDIYQYYYEETSNNKVKKIGGIK